MANKMHFAISLMGQNEEITAFAGTETYTLCIMILTGLFWHLDLHVANVGSSHMRECLASQQVQQRCIDFEPFGHLDISLVILTATVQ